MARRGSGWRRGAALALLATMPLSGCYSLARVDPASAAAPAPGAHLVVTLTDDGSRALTGTLGPGAVTLDGTLDRVTDDGYSIFVRSVEKRDGDLDTWNGEPVVVPRTAAATVSVRRLDRTRSVLLAGAVAVGAVVAGRTFGSGTIFGGSEGGGGPTPGN